jgi:hypothetical protein
MFGNMGPVVHHQEEGVFYLHLHEASHVCALGLVGLEYLVPMSMMCGYNGYSIIK